MEAIFLDIDQGGDNMFADDSSEFMHEYNNLQKKVLAIHSLKFVIQRTKRTGRVDLGGGRIRCRIVAPM